MCVCVCVCVGVCVCVCVCEIVARVFLCNLITLVFLIMQLPVCCLLCAGCCYAVNIYIYIYVLKLVMWLLGCCYAVTKEV